MNIHWTNHAVHRCWERMNMPHHQKNMDQFDAAIKDNIHNLTGHYIPFKVNGDRYLAVVTQEGRDLVIKTVMGVHRKKFDRITTKQKWIG